MNIREEDQRRVLEQLPERDSLSPGFTLQALQAAARELEPDLAGCALPVGLERRGEQCGSGRAECRVEVGDGTAEQLVKRFTSPTRL
jgi:hypothetical protein